MRQLLKYLKNFVLILGMGMFAAGCSVGGGQTKPDMCMLLNTVYLEDVDIQTVNEQTLFEIENNNIVMEKVCGITG